ncbi:RNA polymerase II holoenzyme cyclin-like subunit [Trichomonascus vanleenenianus]|uniref:cyclin-dependent protein serine/threonine kinase regulator SSN8 n=1 Tax=Trichomonascus vanleenenianus TaxID=2268995 RepID=UPI003ECA3C6C
MSANFWESSQRAHWLFSKKSLKQARDAILENDKALVKGSSRPGESLNAFDPQIRLYIHNLILMLGRQLGLRQRVLATAELYSARFFTKVSIHEVNLYVVVAACVYVACKTEESPQHIRTVASEARALWPEYITPDPTKIAECEFYLIEELDSYLIVHHPYKSLNQLAKSMAEAYPSLQLSSDEMQSTWSMINDSYITDLILLYPPHVIAMACVYVTIVLKSPHVRPAPPLERIKARIDLLATYLGDSGINLVKTTECVQEMISLYVRWETYDEATCRSRIASLILAI